MACATRPASEAPQAPPDIGVGSALARPSVETKRLGNGLTVMMLPDARSPLACFQVWVAVGSVDEQTARPGETHGTTGLSHFFEHLMFQGTARFPNYDTALAPLGARSNAFTYQDATVYWACAPREHLGTLIDIESDRFEHMKVDFIHLEPEREVVKSERRQTVDADPGEVAEERAIRNTFDRFPYQWGPIGWMSDLDAITLEEAQQYHSAHYTTDRTLLVIAGGFDPESTLQEIEARWGHLRAPARSPDFIARSEVQPLVESWTGPRHDYLLLRSAEPQVVWSYRAPAPAGPTAREYAALELIDWALTGSKSGRLSQRLVYAATPLLSNLSARLTPLRFAFAYVWRANLLTGATIDNVETILDEELERIAAEGLTPDELVQATASLRADSVRSTLSNSDRAEAIGFSWASTGKPFALFDRLALYPTITPTEVREATSKWLQPAQRARVTLVSPDRLRELARRLVTSDPHMAPLTAAVDQAVDLFLRDIDLSRAASDADRERRAIALLIERAAMARKDSQASSETISAIDNYMRDNEMGATPRLARLEALTSDLARTSTELTRERRQLSRELSRLVRTSRANLAAEPHVRLIEHLLTPLDAPLVAPSRTPSTRNDLVEVESVVIDLFVTFLLEARGLERSADTQRRATLDALTHLLSGPLDEGARSLATFALELARDTRRDGLTLEDRPLGRGDHR